MNKWCDSVELKMQVWAKTVSIHRPERLWDRVLVAIGQGREITHGAGCGGFDPVRLVDAAREAFHV
jgi:hypothetical protein